MKTLAKPQQHHRYSDLPFWIVDREEHIKVNKQKKNNRCCFNHFIGLPVKDGEELPMFDYEIDLFLKLQKHKYLWIKKARGLGITEFFLRYLVYLGVCKNHQYRGKKFFLICGPREKTAIELILRLKTLIRPLKILEESDKTICHFMDVRIMAFPSNHVDTARGYTDVSFIYIDEAAFFAPAEQLMVRDVAEGYIAKTDPTIAMISTPGTPTNMFERIPEASEPTTTETTPRTVLYHQILLPWELGIGKIYNDKEIEQAKKSPSFQREYCLQTAYGLGNVFNPYYLEKCFIYQDEPFKVNPWLRHSLGIDPAYGSSKFAFCLTEWSGQPENKIRIVRTEAYDKADYNAMIQRAYEMIKHFGVNNTFVDGSQPEFIRGLKRMLGEESRYEDLVKRCQQVKGDLSNYMDIIPVNFSIDGRSMIQHSKMLIEDKQAVIINAKLDKELADDLRIAKVNNMGNLDKTKANMDLFDAFRLSMMFYKIE